MKAPRIDTPLCLSGLILCRSCRASLEANRDDMLQCSRCRATYPVQHGIPRLASEAYTASFGLQWKRYDVARPEEDEEVFHTKTGVHPSDLSGMLVLDAGCGGGRYSRLLGERGARVVAVDLSSAVEKAAELCADLPNVRIVQADLLDLPLADAAFDFVFSIGVLHHSPDPRRAFTQVAAKVKSGGKLAVWLYRKNTWPQELINRGVRGITTRLPTRVVEGLAVGLAIFGGVPLLSKTLNKIVNFSNHHEWTLRVCDNFDWYAPRYQSHHTIEELMRWFSEEGFTDLVELSPAKTGRVYDWAYLHNLIIGSGVNVVGRKA